MIGLSPLPTAHPNLFQQERVRASTGLYPSFTLAMGRSLRFRVWRHVLHSPSSDSLSLRLRHFNALTSHVTTNSPDHNAKGTQSGHEAPPTACRHTVSGSLSLAARRSFHLSLTVLVHYRSRTSIQPWRVVPPDSDGISRVPPYSGTWTIRWASVSHTGLSPSPAGLSRPLPLQTPCGRATPRPGPTTPRPKTRFGLLPVRSPLLGESRLISFPGDT